LGARARDRRGGPQDRPGGADAAGGRAGAEQLRGPVPLPHGAGRRVRWQGRPVELLQLLRRHTRLLREGPEPVPQGDGGGGAAGGAALPGRRPSRGPERGAAGEAGARGAGGGEPMIGTKATKATLAIAA